MIVADTGWPRIRWDRKIQSLDAVIMDSSGMTESVSVPGSMPLFGAISRDEAEEKLKTEIQSAAKAANPCIRKMDVVSWRCFPDSSRSLPR